MICKMKSVTIAGRLESFEEIVAKYICKRDIDIESTLNVLTNKRDLMPFKAGSQYDPIVKTALSILKLMQIEPKKEDVHDDARMSHDDMQNFLSSILERVAEEKKASDEISANIKKMNEDMERLEDMLGIDADISRLESMEFIDYRFGRMPKGAYKTLNTYLGGLDVIFVKTSENEKEVWGLYFTPKEKTDEVEEIFASMYFQPIDIPKNVKGSPKEMQRQLMEKMDQEFKKLDKMGEISRKRLSDSTQEVMRIYNIARQRQMYADVRKKAAHSKDFFYIVGWMPSDEASRLEKDISRDKQEVLFYQEDPDKVPDFVTPPTKLKNNFVFRPFELFVEMYGLPGYNEIDPTPLLAITYILFFGMMFGDLGQSAVLSIVGFILYKLKKSKLWQIMTIVGFSGMIWGIIYGSVFGNEEIIHGVITPMDNIQKLLIGTVVMGAVIIIFGMLLNLKNCIRRRQRGEFWFGHNGVAGIAFYVGLMLLVLKYFGGIMVSMFTIHLNIPFGRIPVPFCVVLIAAGVIAMYLNEPLSALVEGKKNWLPKEGMFYVQSFFELFEVLLSFFSNTISFLRIGAFAIVHAGMMMAVAALAQGGAVKVIIVSILGNILVTVMEALIVGIQVLRLEYYEMFSRYFTGNGRPFVSVRDESEVK